MQTDEKQGQRARGGRGIQTVSVSAAREMHARTVRARIPGASAKSTTAIPSTSRMPSFQATRRMEAPQRRGSKTVVSQRNGSVPSHRCNNPRNPECAHCGGVIIPSPAATLPLEDTPSISVGDWTVTSCKRPILNSQELAHWETAELPGLGALPEMIFGHNYVRVANERRRWAIEFNALDALKTVRLEDTGLRVSYSDQWLDSKRNQASNDPQDGAPHADSLRIAKHYDWTYTPEYRGSVSGPVTTTTEESDLQQFHVDNSLQLPVDKLSRRDRILYFDEMILYEDELADNGISVLDVKVRVMTERLLVLSRFFLRVDGVLFRVYDTRVCVEFATNTVLRETKRHEGAYGDLHLQSQSQSHDPKAALRDSNVVVQRLPLVSRECETLQL